MAENNNYYHHQESLKPRCVYQTNRPFMRSSSIGAARACAPPPPLLVTGIEKISSLGTVLITVTDMFNAKRRKIEPKISIHYSRSGRVHATPARSVAWLQPERLPLVRTVPGWPRLWTKSWMRSTFLCPRYEFTLSRAETVNSELPSWGKLHQTFTSRISKEWSHASIPLVVG